MTMISFFVNENIYTNIKVSILEYSTNLFNSITCHFLDWNVNAISFCKQKLLLLMVALFKRLTIYCI